LIVEEILLGHGKYFNRKQEKTGIEARLLETKLLGLWPDIAVPVMFFAVDGTA